MLVDDRAAVAALPRVAETGTRVRWYIGWREERDARFALDLLKAFLGRSYALMKEPARVLHPEDAVEQAFADEFGDRAFVIEVRPEHREAARNRLLVMAKSIAARPVRQTRRLRSVGRLLRDVEFAIQQGDDTAASSSIEELRSGGHLDPANIEYLTLRRHAARGAWLEILEHPDLRRLLDLGPPKRACEAIIQAAYHHIFCPGGVVPAADEWLRRLETTVFPVFATAFRSARGLSALEADACFAVLPIFRSQPRDEAVDHALQRLAQAGWLEVVAVVEAAWALQAPAGPKEALEQLLQHAVLAAPTSRHWSDEASEAYNGDDVDLAYRLALQAKPDRMRAMMLVRCAQAMGDAEATLEALGAWENLGTDEQRVASEQGRMRDFVARLYDRIGQPLNAIAPGGEDSVETARPVPAVPVDGWRGWFQRLRAETPWPGATSAADVGQRTWSTEGVLGNPEAVSEVVNTIESTLPAWAAEAMRNSLPFLQESFVTDVLDTRAAAIVASLFDVLATDDAHTLPSCQALVQLARSRLSCNANTSQYAQTVDAVVGAVESVASPVSLPAQINALEMLVGTPCPAPLIRQNAAIRLLQCSARWWKRFAKESRSLLRCLASELEASSALVDTEDAGQNEVQDEDPWRHLEDKHVAIYSLDEAALARTARALREACPTVRVITFADHVATSPMQDAAKRADIFVIATKAATHAATTFIEKFVESGRISYATGKGSSSLLGAVRRWIDANPAVG